ncbi:MAG: pyridine nucleotide-disulfide oxidoreductase, partial [Bacilli bacterium]
MAFRQIIQDLAQHVSQRKVKFTDKDPEYYIFADLITDEEAKVLLAMRRRNEETVDYVAKKVKKTYAETFEILMRLADYGVIELKPQSSGEDCFELPIYVPGVFELMMLNRENANKHPEIARAFEEYTRTTVKQVTELMPMGNGAWRVIPVESAIKNETRRAP